MPLSQIVLITAIFNLVLGFYTWKNNPKNPINITFGIFVLTISVWIFLNFLFQNNATAQTLKLIYAIGPFIIVNGFLWVNYLRNKKITIGFLLFLITLYALSSLFVYLIFLDGLMIGEVINQFDYITGPMFWMYSFFMIILFLMFISYLALQFHYSKGIQRQQIKYISIGMITVIVIVSIVSYILPTFFNFSYLNIFDSPSTIIFILLATFTILKYQLLDIKVMITEIIIYFLLSLVFIILFVTKADTHLVIKLIFMAFLFYGSYLLINSVRREIEQKEKLQEITTQLAQANAHLQELDKMKTEFVSLASHELLTPVSAIEGYLSMVLDEKLVKVTDPKLQEYLDRVYRSAKRLARLISDMLNISRIEEGRLLVEKQEAELAGLIRQVADEIKFKAEEHKQKVVFESNEQFPTYVDPEKIKEVVVNLIGNSIKYSKNPGIVTVTVEKVPTALINDTWERVENEIKNRPLDDQEAIKSAADPKMRELVGPSQYLIRVKDQGIGIPKDELPKLFKKFHRVGDYSTAESQGTGLGLYISRALVELNHGRIWADSDGEGKGSTFSFSLPLSMAKDKILELEKQIPQDKEQLKPLSKPSKVAEDI